MSQEPPSNPLGTTPASPGGSTPAPAGPLRAPEGAPDTGPEAPIWTGRTHWSAYIGSILLWLLLAVVVILGVRFLVMRGTLSSGTALRVAAAVLGISLLVVLGRILLKVLSCRYRITTQRLFIERGILSQTIDQTELVRLDDVRVRRSLLDRILGIGSIDVISTDVSDRAVVLQGVRDPQQTAEHLRERMRVLRRKSLYVENI